LTNVKFYPSTIEHVNQLAENIRLEDLEEIYLLSGRDARTVIKKSFIASRDAMSAFDDNDHTLLAMFGVKPYSLSSDVASPWFLTTEHRRNRYSKELLRGSRAAIGYWKNEYSMLENYVDARYTQAVRWVKWLGFTVEDAKPMGPFDYLFHRIEIRS
jgi:hypothetical protein